MANPGVYLEVDASELNDEIKFLERVMKPEVFQRAMYGIMQRTGRHVGTILKKDLPKEYHVTGGEIGAVVKSPQLSMGGGMVGCTIPLVGKRKNIGTGFAATGYRRGWRALTSGKYKITAKIVKDGASTLPFDMSSYGGFPPFRNMPSKLGKLTFTRMSKKRGPIEKVSGIAVPQMPMNRSRDQVEHDIVEYMDERINARITALINNGW